MPTVTDVNILLSMEATLSRVARLYDLQGRITTEYKTIPKPTVGITECLKRSFIYNAQNQIVGEQIRTDIWVQSMENLASPPIIDIQLTATILASGLPTSTKIADVLISGGVAPFMVELISNPNNLFRIDNSSELVLNAPSNAGTYPITIQVTDDDGKSESQNFNIVVTAFSNTKSVQLDGVDESILCGTNPDIQFERTNSFSVSGWFKVGSNVGTNPTIIGNLNTATTPRGWRVISGVGGAANIGLQLSATSSNQIVTGTTETFGDNIWHNFIITYDGTSLASGVKVFIDGTERAKTNTFDALNSSIVNSNSLRIGAADNLTQFFNGNLDEIAIWNKVLSESEIQEIYNLGNPNDLLAHSAVNDLLHYWRLGDLDTFPVFEDKKGLNNGTAVNMEALDVKEDTP